MVDINKLVFVSILLFTYSVTQNTLTQDRILILTLTNQERAKLNISPLVFDGSLTNAAQLHAEDMLQNNYFSHTGRNGSSPTDRAGEPAGENIAYNYNQNL